MIGHHAPVHATVRAPYAFRFILYRAQQSLASSGKGYRGELFRQKTHKRAASISGQRALVALYRIANGN